VQRKFSGALPPNPRAGGLRPPAPPSNPPTHPTQTLRHYYSCKEYNTYPTFGTQKPRRLFYSRDVVFREVKYISKHEFLPRPEETKKIELELDDIKYESSEEDEAIEEEEPHTPVLRRSMREIRKPERYSPPDFHSNFGLSITDDDPITVRELVNSEDSKLWKKAMVEEMDALDKNEAWDIVEFLAGRKSVGSK
jgi:hypothetical protein